MRIECGNPEVSVTCRHQRIIKLEVDGDRQHWTDKLWVLRETHGEIVACEEDGRTN